MDPIARRLTEDFLKTNTDIPYRIAFTDSQGNTYDVSVEKRDLRIRKDGFEKSGGQISMGPMGSACPRCGGSGRA